MKKCNKCGISKPETEFHFRNKGIQKLQSRCKTCALAVGKAHYNANKGMYYKSNQARREAGKAFLQKVKDDSKCLTCGNLDSRVLDFHHRDPELKEFNIASCATRGYSIKHMKTEMDKCDVLCSNCYRILHYEERSNPLK